MNRLADYSGYIDEARESWHCPGVAVAIVRDDEVIHQSAHGWRDVENQLPVTVDTRFPLASVTKSFTAMSVALMVDEGKLEWDKPVQEYLPEFVFDDQYVTRHITVRDMLSHRTGLPRHDLAAWRLDLPPADFIRRMRHLKFSASFREKFQYNNLMFHAAAYLVESVARQRWDEFVRDRIFTPLGMTASNFEPAAPQAGQHSAKGYRVDRDDEGVATGLTETPVGLHTELSPGAAGALHSTLADLIRWLKVHVNEGRSGATQLVSPANLKQMHLPHMVRPGGGISEALFGNTIFTYGLGWFVDPYQGLTLVSHGGNVEGHSLVVGFVPQERLGVVVLTNVAGLPLRDALLYESVDRALDRPAADWNAKLHGIFDPILVGRGHGKRDSAAERAAGAPPSRPLATYVGEFEAKGYPDLAVRQQGDELQARLIDNLPWTPLRHYHYDVFEWDLVDWEEKLKVRFLTNDAGEMDAVSLPIEPAVDNVEFTRKSPALTPETIAALVGKYLPPVDGMAFTVTAVDGKVYFAVAGEAPAEVKPYKVTDEVIGFRHGRLRLDFTRVDERYDKLTYKAEGFSLEASRSGGGPL